MNRTQFNSLKEALSEKIFGQNISFIYVADMRDDIAKPYKDLDIKKLSYIQAHITEQDYYEISNETTGLENLGVNLLPLEPSKYNYEKLNGFLANLKDNPENKYMLIRGDVDKDHKTLKLLNKIYVDGNGNVLDEQTVLSYMTPSAIKKMNNEYGRSGKLNLSSRFRSFTWSKIAELNVCGIHLVDEFLAKYIGVAKQKAPQKKTK